MIEGRRRHYSRQQLIAIAAAVPCDPRSVARVLEGQLTTRVVRANVLRALRELGLEALAPAATNPRAVTPKGESDAA